MTEQTHRKSGCRRQSSPARATPALATERCGLCGRPASSAGVQLWLHGDQDGTQS